MTIRILPQDVADQIAAGEVVERPASVIKELVENSIDAGATHVHVGVQDGGRTMMVVEDNGEGMDEIDAKKSVLRHATSKIQNIQDLFAVQSYGFRGEALAAISAVSRFAMLTKTEGETAGIQMEIEGGGAPKITPAAANRGTKIVIKDLFCTTPARLGYLKKDETEYRAVLQEIQGFVLANPSVGFVLEKNGKRVLEHHAGETQAERISSVLGIAEDKLQRVEWGSGMTKVAGYIARPEACVKSRTKQYFFVNGRKIEDYKLSFAVRDAYVRTCGLQKDLYPAFVLEIETDPILVDVNVHPRKKEVKFSEPQEVFNLVKYGVEKALEKATEGIHMSRSSMGAASYTSAPRQSTYVPPKHAGMGFDRDFAKQNTHRETALQHIPVQRYNEPVEPSEIHKSTAPQLQLVGQMADRYVVAQSANGMYIFDQHALHERQRFEQLYAQAEQKNIEIQRMLLPQEFGLAADDVSILLENADKMAEIGFEVDSTTPRNIRVHSVPVMLTPENLHDILIDCVQYFADEAVGEHSVEKFLRIMLEYKSCRGAIKFGDSLTVAEMERLIADFDETKWKLLCPHGRPNHVYMSFGDLDKKFYR